MIAMRWEICWRTSKYWRRQEEEKRREEQEQRFKQHKEDMLENRQIHER